MSARRNEFLDHDISDESDVDRGYDSEAAELSKAVRVSTSGRSVKRRKLSHSDDSEIESSDGGSDLKAGKKILSTGHIDHIHQSEEAEDDSEEQEAEAQDIQKRSIQQRSPSRTGQPLTIQPDVKPRKRTKHKDNKPGVVYLSSLPPYLKPSALRNLLDQRGFLPVTRLFLTPASKAKPGSKKNSRQLYTEGWIEFASKKTARRCAETLNAQIIGGRKGGFYHDDLWNIKYLRGMGWSELMAGIREEKREEEGRRDEERRQIASETKRFIEGVEEGRKIEGIKRKRNGKSGKKPADDENAAGDVKRTWRQFEVKGKSNLSSGAQKSDRISDDVREVLGKIF